MRFPTHWLKIEKLDNKYMLCNVQVKKNASLQTGTGKAEKTNTIHLQTTPLQSPLNTMNRHTLFLNSEIEPSSIESQNI
jgi:hypothetical protein